MSMLAAVGDSWQLLAAVDALEVGASSLFLGTGATKPGRMQHK
jgi:hypothetical protein